MDANNSPCGMICGYLVTFVFAFVALVYGTDFWLVMLCYWLIGPIVGYLISALLEFFNPTPKPGEDIHLATSEKAYAKPRV